MKVDLAVDGPSGTNKHASFPIAKMVTEVSKGNSAPIIRGTLNVAVLKKYKLFDADGGFAHIDMPVTLVRIDNNKGMKAFVDALESVTSEIRIPSSPFEPGVRAFGSFVKSVFESNSNSSDDYPNAILGFELVDSDAECQVNSQALRTGAHAQIFSGPRGAPGVIDVSSYSSYCFYSSGDSDPNILYSNKTAACPAAAPANASILNNPQIIFVVNGYALSAMKRPSAASLTLSDKKSIDYVASHRMDGFSQLASRSTPVSGDKIESGDLISLQNKLSQALAGGSLSGGETKAVELSVPDRAALDLSGATANCSLVGLSPDQCN